MRAVLVAAIATLAWGAAASAAEVPNANSIACPAAPSGWTLPKDMGRWVVSPNQADAVPSRLNDNWDPGRDQVTVFCNYFTKTANTLLLQVSYALPGNINPFNDFDVGCVDNSPSPGGARVWDTKN